jgi:hypothetical protein
VVGSEGIARLAGAGLGCRDAAAHPRAGGTRLPSTQRVEFRFPQSGRISVGPSRGPCDSDGRHIIAAVRTAAAGRLPDWLGYSIVDTRAFDRRDAGWPGRPGVRATQSVG